MIRNHHQKISGIWIPFIMNVFVVFILTCVAILTTAHISLKSNIEISLFAGFGLIATISIFISAFFTFFIFLLLRQFIKPIKKIVEATESISEGNFNIHLDEETHNKEIQNMYISFNKMIKELNSIETLRNDFIVNVSHEFKTPLSSIEGYATLLQDPNITEEERIEYSKIILDSSKQLSSLSGNILALSKLENQEILLETTVFSLDEQIRHAFLFLENKWSEKDIDVNLELSECYYQGNEKLLMQVWLNLLGNAIKFTPRQGTITASLKKVNDNICVIVSDTGIGMDEKTQKHIFDKFYQGDTTHAMEGNGLGLALVKRIINLHKGTISVESEINKGSTFFISL